MKKIVYAVAALIIAGSLISFSSSHKKRNANIETSKATDGHYVAEPTSQF